MIGAGYVRHVGLSEAGAETVHALRAIADAKGVTAAQIAIAWELARGQDMVPLVGTTRRDRLAEAVRRSRAGAQRG